MNEHQKNLFSQMNKLISTTEYLNLNDYDCFLYSADISRNGYEKISEMIPKNKRSKALLILSTAGGDPHAGYRISRCLNHHYETFEVLIPYRCKSAGTLICIGAKKLWMCDKAELGPLDVQLKKQDELYQNGSGLDLIRGLELISKNAESSFSAYLYSIIYSSRMSTKTASEISSNLVIGLFSPIFAQIDPVKFGETNAALSIASKYGERLAQKSNNMIEGKLNELINDYPSHSFVIDRSEARQIFKNIDVPPTHFEDCFNFFTYNEDEKILYLNDNLVKMITVIQNILETSTASGEPDKSDTDESIIPDEKTVTDGTLTVCNKQQTGSKKKQ